ncbi:hypothetical protein [Actinophytocola gossypii]|uniref:Uncharacterized protein n=1 Tax=Actinophytocola gossypii TaxID=2812003 RepID=A0ABT2J4H7_9PSEU|nr:hypothetical protein [Actinophytocola gossypii]MCT2582779.1 hypothetical protein [Actinophytocola gossypii]
MRTVATSAGLSVEVLAGTFALHGVAHVVRAATPPLTVAGGGVFLAAMVTLLVRGWRARRVAPATAVLGVLTVGALTTVHLVPMWGALSEPWFGAGVHLIWWITLWLALAGASWAAVAAGHEWMVAKPGSP